MTKSIRTVFSWKFVFYELLLPALRRLGPARADKALVALGRIITRAWPGRRLQLSQALDRVRGSASPAATAAMHWSDLAASEARFLARDYLLDVPHDEDVYRRFEVHGLESLQAVLDSGRGAVLVGSHFGGHLAGLHWLFRSGMPVDALVQRPPHISHFLSRLFDQRLAECPGRDLFLRRDLTAGASVELMLRARTALRSGRLVYACGDIPWESPNCSQGRLLGISHRFLSIWADLATLTQSPVFYVFCSHLQGGKFRLEIKPVGQVRAGEETLAVTQFLSELESRIADDPTQAVAHLLWPCFHAPSSAPEPSARRRGQAHHLPRPSRRNHATTRESK